MSTAAYWERGEWCVPAITGAATLLDASDMPELAEDLGFALPLINVLDVGCGTGRIAKHCHGYRGVDISRDAVAYCRNRGLDADVISGALMLKDVGRFGWVVCLSVFTHIHESERVEYLSRFAAIAPSLLVDIIPGNGDGDVSLWTAEPDRFEFQLKSAGYEVVATTERNAPVADIRHRYYHARLVAR